MVDFSIILAGFADAFTLVNFAFVLLGVVIGQFVGTVPGIGPVMDGHRHPIYFRHGSASWNRVLVG